MSFFTTTYNKATSYLRTLWRGSYFGCGPRTRKAARRVTLIHVTRDTLTRPFEDLLLTSQHELSVTPARDAGSGSGPAPETWTQRAERILDLGRNVYFYAGRAFPEYGEVALVFGAECAARHTGSATVFDTGELANRRLDHNLPDDRDETLREFTRRNLIPLNSWRSGFRRHLAVNFSDPSHYYDGKPCTAGPAELFSRNEGNCLAWTYEVRFREGQDIFDALEWSSPSSLQPLLRSARKKLPPSSPVRPRLNQFLQRAIIPKGFAHSREIIEQTQQRARGRMGV